MFQYESMLFAATTEVCPEGTLLWSSPLGRGRSAANFKSSLVPKVASGAMDWKPMPRALERISSPRGSSLGVASAVAPQRAKEEYSIRSLASSAFSFEPKIGVFSTAQSEILSSAWSIRSNSAVPVGIQTWGDSTLLRAAFPMRSQPGRSVAAPPPLPPWQ